MPSVPGNLAIAEPSGVMPFSLCMAFAESREFAQLQAQYHDGTTERSQLAATSRRTFKLAVRLAPSTTAPWPSTAALLSALKTFWDAHEGGVVPFLFYNLIEGPYDSTGDATTGRYTVVFRGNWSQSTGASGLQRTDVPQVELVEVA